MIGCRQEVTKGDVQHHQISPEQSPGRSLKTTSKISPDTHQQLENSFLLTTQDTFKHIAGQVLTTYLWTSNDRKGIRADLSRCKI